jgi:2-polyprenyl-3-methyl-5-hydroxy-6-metoxy-1,4-benzoquinol methylase
MQTAMPVKDQVVSANVEFYREIGKKYDAYEACASDTFLQEMLENDVDAMGRRLENHFEQIRCLDCGGGTGNLTLKLLRRGWAVTVVDVSPDMLAVSRAKINASGYTAKFVNDSIEHFLASPTEDFEIVAFSSVLHHLYSPLQVVREVAARIRPGGFFYSNFDPVFPSSRLMATCFCNFDTILAKLIYDRNDVLPGITRRFRKLVLPRDAAHARPIASPGDLAEYHAREGLDDLSIAAALETQGFGVIRVRYAAGRTKMTRWINDRLCASLSFKLMARRKGDRPANLI